MPIACDGDVYMAAAVTGYYEPLTLMSKLIRFYFYSVLAGLNNELDYVLCTFGLEILSRAVGLPVFSFLIEFLLIEPFGYCSWC